MQGRQTCHALCYPRWLQVLPWCFTVLCSLLYSLLMHACYYNMAWLACPSFLLLTFRLSKVLAHMQGVQGTHIVCEVEHASVWMPVKANSVTNACMNIQFTVLMLLRWLVCITRWCILCVG